MIYVVDTHALVRFLEDAPTLGSRAQHILEDPNSSLIVPTIVLAEALYMNASGRTSVTWEDVVNAVRGDGRFATADFTLEVLRELNTGLEMHDAIIVATAILLRDSLGEDVAVITRDQAIRDSGLIQTVW